MARVHATPNGLVEFSTQEETSRNIEEQAWINDASNRKLAEIKSIRLQKLIESDYLALSDVVLSDAWKNKRQSWRDIPQDFTTEQYDLLLARDSNGNLTHTIWSKP